MSAGRPVLVPVGTGAAYSRPGEAQSAHLVLHGGRAVLLDLGAGALNRVQEHVRPEALAAIVITHLHPDHCADLLALRVYMAWGPGRGGTLRVLGPPGLRERLVAFAGEDGWDALRFEVLGDGPGERDLGEGLRMLHVPVPHLPPTQAVRLEAGGGSVCFGADCAPGPELPELARGCDVLLLEASFGADPVPEGVPHLSAADAGELAERAGARRLVLTHCFPEHDRDAALAAARARFSGQVEWARAGEAVPA